MYVYRERVLFIDTPSVTLAQSAFTYIIFVHMYK